MARSTKQLLRTLLAVLVVVSMVGGATLVAAAGTVAADQHDPENAPTCNTSDGDVEFVVNLPEQTDHYPGDSSVHSEQNGCNASIEYFASVQAPLTEEGLWLKFLAVEADWIDYSQCGAGNTKVFGIDRGNDNEGTRSDESLLEHRKGTEFNSDGLDIVFYKWGALSS